jgi:purine nucleosidase
MRRRRIPRLARGAAAVPLLLALVALLSFVISVPGWPTGERKSAPLDLVRGGPPVTMPRRIWIDADAACGHGSRTDADDCFAMLVLLRAPGIEVVGIATVHGNAPVDVSQRIVHELVARMGHDRTPPVHRGSASASPTAPAPAHAALRDALAAGPLTIVALGPLTNVAAALRGRPDLARNVGRLVTVMGRRPGHLFHPSEGRASRILFGHGPVFRDFNFDKDRAAAAEILALGLPVTLVPYEAARYVILSAGDLALLDAAGGAPAWVASRARGWLAFWADVVGLDGFYPFDALAAAYALEPALFDCAETAAWVATDRKLWGRLLSPEALLVGIERERAEKPRASAKAVYCPRISPRLHAWLMARLVGR